MRIAIVCKTFLKGGAEKQALILAKLITEKNTEVFLVNWYGRKIDPVYQHFIEDKSLNYFPLKGTFLHKFFRFQKLLKDEKISIIVSYLTLSNFVSGISKIFNRRIVCIGGIRNEKLPFYKFLFEKLIHNYLNDATVFNNYSAKNKFEKRGFNPGKIHVIQNAIEFNNSHIDFKSVNGEVKIITVARFVRQKDYVTALISFRDLLDKNKGRSFQYIIVGYGPLEKEIRSLAERLKIEQKVKLYINPPDIPEILKAGDIFLSTSLFEGVSNSIMEAMVAGLPVVATDVGDNRYLIKDGSNGYIVPSKDVNKIVEKLECLSESEELRKEFGRNSHKILINEFSNPKLLDNYMRLFALLL